MVSTGDKSQTQIKHRCQPPEHNNSKLITLVANDVREHIQ